MEAWGKDIWGPLGLRECSSCFVLFCFVFWWGWGNNGAGNNKGALTVLTIALCIEMESPIGPYLPPKFALSAIFLIAVNWQKVVILDNTI